MNTKTAEEQIAEFYTFCPSMFFEGRYQITDAKGLPIGVNRDLSDAAMLTRHLNKARLDGIREQVEPLEAENAKLRALVQGILDLSFHDSECDSHVWNGSCDCMKRMIDERVKEAGFVPTNTTEGR